MMSPKIESDINHFINSWMCYKPFTESVPNSHFHEANITMYAD